MKTSISDESTAIEILASKFRVITEIMTKHCWDQFWLGHPADNVNVEQLNCMNVSEDFT